MSKKLGVYVGKIRLSSNKPAIYLSKQNGKWFYVLAWKDALFEYSSVLPITEGFLPSQNIIVKPWVYMGFFIIQIYFHLSCVTFHMK